MKAGFILPSCNYNIVLSKKDLEELLTKGHLLVDPERDVPCHTGRVVVSADRMDFGTLDQKNIPNHLCFKLEEDVADMHRGRWHVQFLGIFIEGFEKREEPNENH